MSTSAPHSLRTLMSASRFTTTPIDDYQPILENGHAAYDNCGFRGRRRRDLWLRGRDQHVGASAERRDHDEHEAGESHDITR